MKKLSKSRVLAVSGAAALFLDATCEAGQLRGGDSFDGTVLSAENWSYGLPGGQSCGIGPNASLPTWVVGGGRLSLYHEGYQRMWARWAANAGSATNDWFVQVEGNISDGIFQNQGFPVLNGSVGLWLRVVALNECRSLSVLLDNWRYEGGPAPSDRYLAWYSDGGTLRSRVQLAAAAGTFRIRWSAGESRLRVEYDVDGAGNGWQWNLLGSYDVGSTGANWGLDDDSQFHIYLQATVDGLSQLNPGSAWFDNFLTASRPIILMQPEARSVDEGAAAALSVGIEADPSAVFLWRRNGQLVPNSNVADLSFDAVAAEDGGDYQVTVTNLAGSVSSIPVTLTVNPNPDLPAFQQQPQNISSYVGQSVQFSVQVQSATLVSYQWLHASTNLPGKTGATLSLTGLTTADAGEYRVRVTNPAGSRLSQAAHLTVAATPPPRMEYVRFGPTLILHWPSSATGFAAWSGECMDGPWSQITGGYFLYQGNRLAIQADTSQGTRYFRLQK